MQTMERVFTQDIPPPLRRVVLTALTTQTLIHRQFVNCDDNGCPVVVAAFAAAGKQFSQAFFEVCDDLDGELGRMLCLAPGVAEQCWKDWDAASDEERTEFVERRRLQLAALPADDDDDVVPPEHVRFTGALAKVGAILAVLAIVGSLV